MEREGEEGSLSKGWSCETNWTVAKGSSSLSCRHLRRRDGNPWRLSRLHLIFSILGFLYILRPYPLTPLPRVFLPSPQSQVMEFGMNFLAGDGMSAVLQARLTKIIGFGITANMHITGNHLGQQIGLCWPYGHLKDADFINSDGAAMNKLLLEAKSKMTLLTGSSRVAEKLTADLKGRIKLEDAGFDRKIPGHDVQM